MIADFFNRFLRGSRNLGLKKAMETMMASHSPELRQLRARISAAEKELEIAKLHRAQLIGKREEMKRAEANTLVILDFLGLRAADINSLSPSSLTHLLETKCAQKAVDKLLEAGCPEPERRSNTTT